MTGPTMVAEPKRYNYITGSILEAHGQGQGQKGPYSFASSPRALYTNKKLFKAPCP